MASRSSKILLGTTLLLVVLAVAVLAHRRLVMSAPTGAKRAFVTDDQGRIVREISPGRVKVRVSFVNDEGQVFETFRKIGSPGEEDLQIFELLD